MPTSEGLEIVQNQGNNDLRSRYPLREEEAFPIQKEPMFHYYNLVKAYEHFKHFTKSEPSAENFFYYLLKLEEDVSLASQRCQP